MVLIAAVAADADVHDRPVLAVGPQLRGDRRDRRDRAQPADRLHRPGLARPRVLHRRRRLHGGRGRRRPRPAAGPVAARRRAVRRARGRADRPVRAAPARQLPGDRDARAGLPRRATCSATCEGVTGGNSGTSVTASATLGPIDFNAVTIFGDEYIRNQGWFWLVWGLVALVRAAGQEHRPHAPGPGDPGDPRPRRGGRDRRRRARALQGRGVRGLERASRRWRGALYGAYQQYVSPDEWTLFLSIQYIAIIIVGGVGTIFGAVLGALFLGGLPAVIENYSDSIPGVADRRRRRRLHLGLLPQPGHLRPADRAVPDVRAAWAGRHVAACEGLFQGVAVLVLIPGGGTA